MKLKVNVDQLREGMFVSDLDRSWAETSFLLEGVLLRGQQDFAELRRVCEYVYVDTERSYSSALDGMLSRAPGAKPSSPGESRIAKAARLADHEQQNFSRQLKQARGTHQQSRDYIQRIMQDVRLGNSLDTGNARQLVSQITENITQSPNAMLWLSHLKHRDEYTVTHCLNTCILAVTFGRFLGLDNEQLNLLGLGALLHDIGKMLIPREILNKPGRLTAEEYAIVKTHAAKGHALLQRKGNIPQVSLNIVLSHHERVSGKGYPHGQRGEHIDMLTKITSIVDVYDAITSDRCYHDGIAPYDALRNMYEWISEDFDKDLVEKFIKCLGIYPIGSMVQLNTGQIGIVVSASEKSRLRPIVLLVINSKGERYPKPRLINLAHPRWQQSQRKLEIRKILDNSACDIDLPNVIQNEALI